MSTAETDSTRRLFGFTYSTPRLFIQDLRQVRSVVASDYEPGGTVLFEDGQKITGVSDNDMENLCVVLRELLGGGLLPFGDFRDAWEHMKTVEELAYKGVVSEEGIKVVKQLIAVLMCLAPRESQESSAS